jgi:integrase/DNA-binding XRE family transcriptional regulator
MPNLTKRFIDSIAATRTRQIHWDSVLKGFGLLILPTGVRSFVFNYRNADGRRRRCTIGRFGTLTVEQARVAARDLAGRVARGEDPAATSKSRRDAPTVSKLLDDYLADHVEVENKPKTRETVRSAIKLHIRPFLGALKVAAVTRQDAQRLHKRMEKTPRAANLTLAVLSKAMTFAEESSLRPQGSNPCRGVKRYRENRRNRFLSGDEMSRLGQVMEEAETVGLPWRKREGAKAKHRPKEENCRTLVNSRALAVIRLLLFTGARLSEIRELRWRDVDLECRTIALPDRKGGDRRAHPVSTMALRILEALPRVTQKNGKPSPWVFPAPKDASKPLSRSVVSNAWQAVRARAGIPDVRLHDERHTAGTFAGQTGANAFLVRDILRHTTTATTDIYVNADEDPMRATFQAIGRRIEAGLAGASPQLQRLAAIQTPDETTGAAADLPPAVAALASIYKSRVAAVRLWRGLTQAELAAKVGVPPAKIKALEAERAPQGSKLAKKLADAFDVPLVWLA